MIEFETEVDIKKVSLKTKPVVEFGRDAELVDKLSESSETLYAKPLQNILDKTTQPTTETALENPLLNREEQTKTDKTSTQPSQYNASSEYTYVSDDDLPEALSTTIATKNTIQNHLGTFESLRRSSITSKQSIDEFELPKEVPSLLEDNSVELTPIDLNRRTSSYVKNIAQALLLLTLYIATVFCCFHFISDDAIRMIVIAALSFLGVTVMIVLSAVKTIKKYEELYARSSL